MKERRFESCLLVSWPPLRAGRVDWLLRFIMLVAQLVVATCLRLGAARLKRLAKATPSRLIQIEYVSYEKRLAACGQTRTCRVGVAISVRRLLGAQVDCFLAACSHFISRASRRSRARLTLNFPRSAHRAFLAQQHLPFFFSLSLTRAGSAHVQEEKRAASFFGGSHVLLFGARKKSQPRGAARFMCCARDEQRLSSQLRGAPQEAKSFCTLKSFFAFKQLVNLRQQMDTRRTRDHKKRTKRVDQRTSLSLI